MDETAMRKLMLSQGDQETDLGARKLAATIARIHKTLKSRRAEAVTWTSAKEGMSLYDRDVVQTMNQSSALIQFSEGSALQMVNAGR